MKAIAICVFLCMGACTTIPDDQPREPGRQPSSGKQLDPSVVAVAGAIIGGAIMLVPRLLFHLPF